ncbi:unnamed protein product, partial [Phaeothamnion confervicola]
IHEQLSKNRVIIELDAKGCPSAAITSSTHERKTRCNIYVKNGKVYLKQNALGDDVPIVIVLKAMGMESDQEIVQLVGSEPEIVSAFAASLEEAITSHVYTTEQALTYMGQKMRAPKAGARARLPQQT